MFSVISHGIKTLDLVESTYNQDIQYTYYVIASLQLITTPKSDPYGNFKLVILSIQHC